MKLSEHFTLQELIQSQTATRRNIDNYPGEEEKINLFRLCKNVLEQIRELSGKKIYISSGYRCRELNRLIGGSRTSQHCHGEAADISAEGMSTTELYNLVKNSSIIFDQLICEFADSEGGGWVHVSYKEPARRNCLIASHRGGKVIYTKDQ